MKIKRLVEALPEIYQPIFSHPELSVEVSRPCHDRLRDIARIHDELQNYLTRPLRVLDLGCAQGFFSLNLAARGAIVHGVDYLDKNVAVCSALADENKKLNATFEVGLIEDIVNRVQKNEFDIVLGLSVFHHIVHIHGIHAVRAMLNMMASKCGVLILELALKEEPLYWGSSQPDDPLELLQNIAFVHELARHSTHLTEIPRPLVLASNEYWILPSSLERFDNYRTESHALANGTHEGSRRYFFSKNSVLKQYKFKNKRGEYNRKEYAREVNFLNGKHPDFPTPELKTAGATPIEGWVITERINGSSLLDLLSTNTPVDHYEIILTVLKQLATLESEGLYHDDVRCWNVLLDQNDQSAKLIDFGAISESSHDCAWPQNRFLSFFIFVKEVSSGIVEHPQPLRTVAISPFSLPEPYRAWAFHQWMLPIGDWTFEKLYKSLLSTGTKKSIEDTISAEDVWKTAVEEGIQILKKYSNHLDVNIKSLSLSTTEKIEQQGRNLAKKLSMHEAYVDRILDEKEERINQYLQQKENEFLRRIKEKEKGIENIFDEREVQILNVLENQKSTWESKFEKISSTYSEQILQSTQLNEDELRKQSTALGRLEFVFSQHVRTVEHQVNQINLLRERERQLAAELYALRFERDALKNSISWRITAPARLLIDFVRHPVVLIKKIVNRLLGKALEIFQRPIAGLIRLVTRNPQLSEAINRRIQKYPPLHGQLLQISKKWNKTASVRLEDKKELEIESGDLGMSTQARQIYEKLKKNINYREGSE